jgi:hypothetical protein
VSFIFFTLSIMDDTAIEETDDLLENEYLNDGFDDVDCDVDDLMKAKGRVCTGSTAKTVEEDIAKLKKKEQQEQKEAETEKEDEPLLDYSDFFAGDNTTTEGVAIMQLKSVPVMRQNSDDPDEDINVFPLPYSERRAVVSPQVDELMRESRSSHQDLKRSPSPIVNNKPVAVKMSKALSRKIATKAALKKQDAELLEPSLPPIANNKKPKKSKVRVQSLNPRHLEEKSVSSEREAAKEHKLPQIHKEKKNKIVPLKSKRNKAEIAQAKVIIYDNVLLCFYGTLCMILLMFRLCLFTGKIFESEA